MIMLTRPDGSRLLVNPNRIETVEQTPDTVITLADGKKLLVRETADVVSSLFLAHHRAVHALVEGSQDGVADWPGTPPTQPTAARDGGGDR